MEQLLISIVVWVIILAGLIGTIVPVLPGVGLIFAGILVHVLYFGAEEIGIVTLVTLGAVAALSTLFDYLASAYGAARLGSTKFGVVGSVIGGIVGVMFLNVPGLVLGIFLGAIAGEMLFAGKSMHQSLRAGLGSVLGFLGGTILKLILGLAMIATFLVKVYF